MLHQEFEPPEDLRNTIKCFWYNTGNFGEIPSSFEVVPDGYPEIIFYFGNLCSITDNGSPQPLPSPFMIGLLNQPVVFQTQNRLDIIGIRCFPWTVFDLLGLPAGKDGLRIFEHPIAHLQVILADLVRDGKIAEVITEIERYFLNAELKTDTNSILTKAGTAMGEAKGTLPVGRVAEAAHATVRTLERKFKQSSGYSVKDVSGLMRFEQVRNHLWQHPGANLASLAHELGYADQAHLSKEFKRYSGTTPAAFARNTKRTKAAKGSYFVLFTQSHDA